MKHLFLFLISIIYTNTLVGEIYVSHEWDPLKVIIVGGVLKNTALYSKKLEDEIKNVNKILEDRGIKIYHFEKFLDAQHLRLPLYPQDPLLIIDNFVIGCAMKARHRRNEIIVMRNELLSIFLKEGAHYMEMATPLFGETFKCCLEGGNLLINGNELYVGSMTLKNFSSFLWLWTKSTTIFNKFLSKAKLQSIHNYLEAKRTINYPSKGAIEWLKQHLPNHYNIHEIQIAGPSYTDLDKCLSLVRPGLGVICRNVIVNELPDSIKNWDFIEISPEEMETNGASLLILDEKNIIIDERNPRITQELRKRDINVIEVPFEQVGKYGGGLRCFHKALLRKK